MFPDTTAGTAADSVAEVIAAEDSVAEVTAEEAVDVIKLLPHVHPPKHVWSAKESALFPVHHHLVLHPHLATILYYRLPWTLLDLLHGIKRSLLVVGVSDVKRTCCATSFDADGAAIVHHPRLLLCASHMVDAALSLGRWAT